jgi:hypothetical protein
MRIVESSGDGEGSWVRSRSYFGQMVAPEASTSATPSENPDGATRAP